MTLNLSSMILTFAINVLRKILILSEKLWNLLLITIIAIKIG